MDQLIQALISSGPIGLLAAALIFAIIFLSLWLRAEISGRLADQKEVRSVLIETIDAAHKATASREALADALKTIATAQQTILGKLERISALLEHGRGGHD